MFDKDRVYLTRLPVITYYVLVSCEQSVSFSLGGGGGGGGGGLLPKYDMVRISGPNSPLFHRCQVYDKPPFSFLDWYMNAPIFTSLFKCAYFCTAIQPRDPN